eukprot:gene9547-9711_t
MPSESCDVLVGFGGRWERWLPPAANTAAVVQQQPEPTGVTRSSVQAQGWQLISSGQSVYCFRPGAPPGENVDSALTVHVMEAPDRCPTTLEAACCYDDSASSHAEFHADIHRSTNRFTVDDVFFKHPSLEPGVGCRWGWNIQYEPSGAGTLDHIHHTSLQLLALQAAVGGEDVEQQLQPGLFPPPTPDTWGTEG